MELTRLGAIAGCVKAIGSISKEAQNMAKSKAKKEAKKEIEHWMKHTDAFANLPAHVFQWGLRKWVAWEIKGEGLNRRYEFRFVRSKKEATVVSGRQVFIMFRTLLNNGFSWVLPVEL